MNMNNFVIRVRLSAVLLITITTLGLASDRESQKPNVIQAKDKKPNILLIYTDEQPLWTVGAYGATLLETPHIDAIAEEGVLVKRFFAISPVCSPSRASLMTGLNPFDAGVPTNGPTLTRDQRTLADMMNSKDYHTGYIGKWHLGGGHNRIVTDAAQAGGFQDFRYMFGGGHFKKVIETPEGEAKAISDYTVIGDEQSYTTDYLTHKALGYIKERAEENEPFFLTVSYPDPHGPVFVRAPYDTMYDQSKMPLPPHVNILDRPDWMINPTPNLEIGIMDREEKIRNLKALYCGEVKCIDDNIGKMMALLKKLDLYNNTIVVFTSDHGVYMGEHGGLTSKNNIYYQGSQVPFLFRWPNNTSIKPGTVITQLMSTIDFKPTLAGLLDIANEPSMEGRDMSSLFKQNGIPEGEDEVYLYSTISPKKRPNGEVIIRQCWAGVYTSKYCFCLGMNSRQHLLFDMDKDPEQLNNLYGKKKYEKISKELGDKVVKYHRDHDTPLYSWLQESVY